MNIHLFCLPGDDIKDIVETAKPYLAGRRDPVVLYLPGAEKEKRGSC